MDAVVDNRIAARPGALSMTPSPNNAMNISALGQVFAPAEVVQAMLAMRQNFGRVLEPSAGAGAFMRAPELSMVGIELGARVFDSYTPNCAIWRWRKILMPCRPFSERIFWDGK